MAVPGSSAAPPDPASVAQGTYTGRPLRSVADWDARFAQAWRSGRADALRLSRSRDSWDHYDASYSVDALTAAFRATGKREYLDDALILVENVVRSAGRSSSLPGSQYRDTFLGWASSRNGGNEIPLYESYFWRYATTLLVVIRQHHELSGDTALQARYRALVSFAEQNVADKWYRRGANQNVFRSRTHMAAHWALISLNLAALTTDATHRSRDLGIVSAVDGGLPNVPSSLRRQLTDNPADQAAYFWSDVWASTRRPGQDVAHGNGVIAYVVEANGRRSGWTAADMRRFIATLADVIWPHEGRGAAFVDGSGTGTGWFSDGFVKLGRFDAGLQRRLETHQPANGQFLANGALNAAILLGHGTPR
jgi:hypothetical protein